MSRLTKVLSVLCALAFLVSAEATQGECTHLDAYLTLGIVNTSQRLVVTDTQQADCCDSDPTCVGCVGSQAYRFWADVYELDIVGNWVFVYSVAGCTDDLSDDNWYKVVRLRVYGLGG